MLRRENRPEQCSPTIPIEIGVRNLTFDPGHECLGDNIVESELSHQSQEQSIA